jgi:hypothetical protein
MDNIAFAVAFMGINVGNGTPYSPRVPSGDFADSLAVFAVCEPIGLKSNIQLSGVLIKVPSITSPDVSAHLQPG